MLATLPAGRYILIPNTFIGFYRLPKGHEPYDDLRAISLIELKLINDGWYAV